MKYLLSLFALVLLMNCTAQNNSKYAKIEYEAGACFGFCPIFKMTINPDRTAVIEAQHFTFEEGRGKGDFNKEPEGNFTATIKKADYDKLISLLENANLKSLNSYYGNKNVTDLPTSYLKVAYTDGTSKHIEDYGKGGTEKLDEIYQFLEDFRKTQAWTKVK